MKKKIKLRDLTEEQYNKWREKNCHVGGCEKCPFHSVECSIKTYYWINNKHLYSDKFLNQEIEIEVTELLTKEEKEYLENLLRPFKEVVNYIVKERDNYNIKEYIDIRICNGECITLPYFNYNEYYKNLEVEKEYTLKELGLFEESKYKITLTEFWNSNDKLAIHCDTEEKANKLLKAFDKLGKKWSNGNSYLQYNYYKIFKENACYINRNTHGDVWWLKKDNVTIYEFEDVDLEN